MQKWTTIVAVGLLTWSFASGASAQARRRANREQVYPAGQYQQGQNQQGQNYQAQRTAGRSQRAAGPMEGANFSDQQLADWLLVDNRGEIQLARLAQERAGSDEVKKFAKHIIDDHAQIVEQLQRFAGTGRNTQAAAQNGQQGINQYGGLNFVRLKQQLGQQCLASAQQELEEKEGAEFDKCYLGLQIAKHMEMMDTLKVFSRYASPQLDQVIEDGEQITQDHLDKAKELIKEHEGKGKSRSSGDHASSAHDRSSSSRESHRDRDADR